MTRKQQQEHGLELVKIVFVLAGTNVNNVRCCGDSRRERGTWNYVYMQVRITSFSYQKAREVLENSFLKARTE